MHKTGNLKAWGAAGSPIWILLCIFFYLIKETQNFSMEKINKTSVKRLYFAHKYLYFTIKNKNLNISPPPFCRFCLPSSILNPSTLQDLRSLLMNLLYFIFFQWLRRFLILPKSHIHLSTVYKYWPCHFYQLLSQPPHFKNVLKFFTTLSSQFLWSEQAIRLRVACIYFWVQRLF